MAHGTPDWGVTAGAETTHQLTDLGELAVRLGSIDTFDRRGDVIFLDDFEHGVAKWELIHSGAGGAGAVDTTHARNGAGSLKLTAGSDTGKSSVATASLPYPVLSRFGLELSFGTNDTPDSFFVRAKVFDGVNATVAAFNWDQLAGQLQISDATGTLVSVASYNINRGAPMLFSTMKLVFDPRTGLYTRLLFNERDIDLSAKAMLVGADATAPEVLLFLEVFGRALNNDAIYVDDVIVTQNEPA